MGKSKIAEETTIHDIKPPPSTSTKYIAGMAAGAVSTITGYPLDAIRVRMIFHSSTSNITNGFAFSFLYSIGKNGLVWPIQKTLQDSVKEKYGESTLQSTVSNWSC
eukprot:TRINITY_DN6705_c0_g1_i2.p1 TRINITY_DN6705_c0_g1~~TRINITY_DN6705_c0_g1_i2.p1  ORF type:complete len:106 (-),score=8.84 TRINITY_DN6705_c0_g1_i2:24-341(-)